VVSIETFVEQYPVLVVAPFSAVMFVSALQDRRSKGFLSPVNYYLWLGALAPFGWACILASRPWQLAAMITFLVIYCAGALKLFLSPNRDVSDPEVDE